MATIKFILQSKKDTASIYLRFSIDRENVYKRKTNYVINPKNWSVKKGLPLENDENLKNLNSDLNKLRRQILDNYNHDLKTGTIDSNWLQLQIDNYQNKIEKTQLDILVNSFQSYIDFLPVKIYTKNGEKTKGVVPNTIKKYKALKPKISSFENAKKKTFLVRDVDLNFISEFETYLKNIENLNDNSIGRYIKCVKTVCKYANKYKYVEVSKQLDEIEGYSEKVEPIYLDFDEIEKISKTFYERTALENAKDWLIIGCFIGQRVSDLLSLTMSNIQIINGIEVITLTQQKTKKKVSIAMPPQVKEILNKRNGNFPQQISATKFNLHLKDVCKIAGINQIINGSLINSDTIRKEKGKYFKWQLATSHICRRSFATNFYSDIPTSILKDITAHSTEKQFLEYIGKSSPDFVKQQSDYWTKLTTKRNEDNLKIRKLA